MKMIMAMVDNRDAEKVMTALTGQHIGVTRISSTGGLLDPGNATLLIGVDEQYVPQVMKVIADLAALRPSYVYIGDINFEAVTEVQVGGFLSFVLDVDHFEQV